MIIKSNKKVIRINNHHNNKIAIKVRTFCINLTKINRPNKNLKVYLM